MSRSRSTATTCAPRATSRAVRWPSPAPSSTTESPGARRGEPRDVGEDRLVAEEVLSPALLRAEPVLLEERARRRVAAAASSGTRHRRHAGSAFERPAPRARRAGSAWVPATAIIAALSVQSRGAAAGTPRIPSYSARAPPTAARSRLFAATPPESTSRSNWSRRAARKAFSTSARDDRLLVARAQVGERLPLGHAVLRARGGAARSSARRS